MRLPVISGKQLVKALSKEGFVLDHTTGSHAILRQEIAPFKRVTVPLHPELAKGTLLAILRQAGIEREKLFDLLE